MEQSVYRGFSDFRIDAENMPFSGYGQPSEPDYYDSLNPLGHGRLPITGSFLGVTGGDEFPPIELVYKTPRGLPEWLSSRKLDEKARVELLRCLSVVRHTGNEQDIETIMQYLRDDQGI